MSKLKQILILSFCAFSITSTSLAEQNIQISFELERNYYGQIEVTLTSSEPHFSRYDDFGYEGLKLVFSTSPEMELKFTPRNQFTIEFDIASTHLEYLLKHESVKFYYPLELFYPGSEVRAFEYARKRAQEGYIFSLNDRNRLTDRYSTLDIVELKKQIEELEAEENAKEIERNKPINRLRSFFGIN